ncbi:molybdenum cofactor guanylyltransferase MobA [Marinobacter lacisalsi]|uniref:Molybdenum cofactor guanylyltransferase n=1 Tax=Marinobacter lacisalsi TaxID=475979 RepID=A0ABV8QLQ2_9GAMM
MSESVIAGLILAGGEGRRMGGVDKGLVDWHGRSLVARVMDALAPVASPVWISANRSLAQYRLYSDRLVGDPAGFRWQGPMAGLLAGLRAAAESGADAVVASPCDTPNVTPELFRTLYDAYQTGPGSAVVARSGDRLHPLHGVYPVSLVPMLEQRLKVGDRKVMAFVEAAGARFVTIEPPTLFDNINRLREE